MNGVQDAPPTWREWLLLAITVPPAALVLICGLAFVFEGWVRAIQSQ